MSSTILLIIDNQITPIREFADFVFLLAVTYTLISLFRSIGSLLHLLKSSLGTGILAMPMAFKNGGLLFGFIGTLVVGVLCTHCVHILVSELCYFFYCISVVILKRTDDHYGLL